MRVYVLCVIGAALLFQARAVRGGDSEWQDVMTLQMGLVREQQFSVALVTWPALN